jgi:tripartite motif-containing protein 71
MDSGPGAGVRFYYPRGLAVDRLGNLYVVEWGRCRVQKLSATGEPLANWRSDREPRQLDQPHAHGVAVDGLGNVYVAESRSRRVHKLSSAGEPLAEWGA